MHLSPAVTMDEIRLGLAAVKVWTRKKGAAFKDKVNPTRVPIEKESFRWLKNMKQATELLTEIAKARLLRSVDRSAGDGDCP